MWLLIEFYSTYLTKCHECRPCITWVMTSSSENGKVKGTILWSNWKYPISRTLCSMDLKFSASISFDNTNLVSSLLSLLLFADVSNFHAFFHKIWTFWWRLIGPFWKNPLKPGIYVKKQFFIFHLVKTELKILF